MDLTSVYGQDDEVFEISSHDIRQHGDMQVLESSFFGHPSDPNLLNRVIVQINRRSIEDTLEHMVDGDTSMRGAHRLIRSTPNYRSPYPLLSYRGNRVTSRQEERVGKITVHCPHAMTSLLIDALPLDSQDVRSILRVVV